MSKDQKSKSRLIELYLVDRVLMSGCYVFQIMLFLYFNVMIVHYTFMPMPAIFAGPSLLSSPYKDPSYLFNAALYASFFVQHVVMAMIIFKVKLERLYPRYPLYERFIYNMASSVAEIVILASARPVSDHSTLVFTTPMYFNAPITLIASGCLLASILRLGGDIFSPFPIRNLLFNTHIEAENYQKPSTRQLVSSGLYAYCRHPMQGSVMLLLIFASNIYTVDRLIFIFVNIVGIFIGVMFEEKRLRIKFPRYSDYQKSVPYKFLPFLI